MQNKTLLNSLFFTFSLFGSFFVLDKPLNADDLDPVCPDPSKTEITSIYDPDDETSFFELTGGYGEEGGGFCRGTPEQYGVTVFKMGFCKKNPANPTGSLILEGSKPEYGLDSDNCTWAFESTTGEAADFSVVGSVDLSEVASSSPAAGTYPHAVMIISKDFRIKGKYGPVAGKTYYTNGKFEESSTNISDYAVTTAPLKSFSGPTECTATTENNVVEGGTISAYLLDATGTILVSDEKDNTGAPCSGMEKLLGVMNMSSDLIISDKTKGLKMTFLVKNNGMSVISNGGENQPPSELIMDSGPFSVTFETF